MPSFTPKNTPTSLLPLTRKTNLTLLPLARGPLPRRIPNHDLVRLKKNKHYWKGEVQMGPSCVRHFPTCAGTLAKLLRSECDVLNSPILAKSQLFKLRRVKDSPRLQWMSLSLRSLTLSTPDLRDSCKKGVEFGHQPKYSRLGLLRYGHESLHAVASNFLGLPKDSVQVRYDRNWRRCAWRSRRRTRLELSMWVPLEPSVYNPSPRKPQN